MPAQVRAFFINLTQVSLLTAVMISLVFLTIRPDPTHYFAGSRLQLDLLKNTPSPRIILVGGSNVAFGVDAAMMQKTLGVPVINDGLHAGLGIVPLRELLDYLRPGDVVILSLEYQVFSDQDVMKGDFTFLSDWIEYSPERIQYLSDPWRQAPSVYAIMLQRKFNRQVSQYLYGNSLTQTRSVYIGTNYDANGDFIGHLNRASMAPRDISSEPYAVMNMQDEIFVFLDQFRQAAREKGAVVYFEAPASRKLNCKKTDETLVINFLKTFEKKSSIPVLTPMEEVCLPNKYFFDTAYHLNAEGRQVRTQRLIDSLIEFTDNFK